jgi:glycosyltransferase involved in cell wall biosynthesis
MRAVLAARPRILQGWLLRGNAVAAGLGVLLPETLVLTSEQNIGHALTSRAKRLVERFVAELEDICLANSTAVAEAAAQRNPARRSHIRVILPGIDQLDREGPRESVTCVSIGRLEAIKDHQTLLRAWSAVSRRHPDATLAVLGEGPEEGALRRLVEELDIGGTVELVGDRDPLPYLRSALVYVSTSRGEGFSRAMLEALSMGVPIVSTNVGGALEIPRDALRLVPVGDAETVGAAISDLLADAEARERASRAAGEAFRTYFQRERCHAAYRDLYASCLN